MLSEIKRQVDKVYQQGQALERELLVLDERLTQIDERLAVLDTRLSRTERER